MSFIQKAKEKSLNIREGRTIEILCLRCLYGVQVEIEKKTVCAGISDLVTVVTAHSTDLIILEQE